MQNKIEIRDFMIAKEKHVGSDYRKGDILQVRKGKETEFVTLPPS